MIMVKTFMISSSKIIYSTIFTKYILFGLINTLITYLAYLLLLRTENFKAAYAITYFIGIILNFSFNSIYVFKSPFSIKNFFIFLYIPGIQFLLSYILLNFFVTILEISPKLAPILNILFLVPIGYFLVNKQIGDKTSK